MSAKKSKMAIPNGYFKKYIYSFGLCFSWAITIFCLLFGEAKNAIHSQLAIYSFLTGVIFTLALVFKARIEIDTKYFKCGIEHDESIKNHN